MLRLRTFFLCLLGVTMIGSTGYGFDVAISTSNPSGLQGVPFSFSPSAVAGFDTNHHETIVTLFDAPAGNLNAFHIDDNGNYLFSTTIGFTLDGSTFADGEIVQYDPITEMASSFINFEDILGAPVDIDVDSFSLLPDGQVVFSTLNANAIAADPNNSNDMIEFTSSDLMIYDPSTLVAAVYLEGDLITGGDQFNNVSAVSVQDDGTIALAVLTGGVPDIFLGGATFQRHDVVLYDPVTGTASIMVEGAETFVGPANPNVDAFHVIAASVPEPSSLWLLAAGLFGSLCRSRKGA